MGCQYSIIGCQVVTKASSTLLMNHHISKFKMSPVPVYILEVRNVLIKGHVRVDKLLITEWETF